MQPPALSVVIPVFNEKNNLEPLYERLEKTLNEYGKTYEVLFIDDGSTDGSFLILEALHGRAPAVRVVQFVRNFGQQMALSAGFQYARGEVVVLLDADLQVSPEDIPRLIEKLNEGYDIVYGVRTRRVGSIVRRAGSWMMSHLLYRVTGIDIPDSASGFIALSRQFVDTINLFNEKSKYLNGLFAWLSYGRAASIPIAYSPRLAGKSKYTVTRLVGLTLNFVCNFTVLPLRFILYLGILLAAASVCLAACLAVNHFFGLTGRDASGWLIIAAAGLLSGVQLASLGIVGEYLGRVYREVREQPAYVVRKILDRSE